VAHDPDALPDSGDLSGPCPRCGRVAAFAAAGASIHIKADGSEQVSALRCMGCNDAIVVVERIGQPPSPGQPAVYEGMHWWPMPGSADLDADIPPGIGSAYSEGLRALAVKAPRAAAVMFRGMLAQFVADKGSAAAQAKHTLYDKLEQMSQDGSLHPSLVEWAKEIRLIGNAAAHPDALDPVSEQEAAELGRLCRQLLDVIYEVPARITRSRTARGVV
jgi:hypothetical protein